MLWEAAVVELAPRVQPVKDVPETPVYVIFSSPICTVPDVVNGFELLTGIVVTESLMSDER